MYVVHNTMIATIFCLSVAFVVAELSFPKSPQELLELANEVEKEANQEELTILRTLLQQRSSWHPDAGRHLDTVVERVNQKRRLTTTYCNDFNDNVSCIGATAYDYDNICVPCKWEAYSATSGYCKNSECQDYTNETDCCANAGGVPTGCYWSPNVQSMSKCRKMTCEDVPKYVCPGNTFSDTCSASQNICGTLSNCQYSTCMGCRDSHETCTCTPGTTSGGCSSGTTSLGNLFSFLTCPLLDCTNCLKGGNAADTTAQKIQKRTTTCAMQCASSIHCDEEARCLLEGSPTSNAKACPKVLPTPHPSCGTVAFTTSTTTAAHYDSCVNMCTNFESTCNNSCGAQASCIVPVNIGRRQTVIGLGVLFGSMFFQ